MKPEKTKHNDKDKHGSKLIAENISTLLQKNNLNANQLANILGIPMMTIRRLMSGETEDPRVSTLKLISNYFNVPLDMIAGDTEKKLLISAKQIKSYLIPKLTWDILKNVNGFNECSFQHFSDWHSFSLNNNNVIGKNAFALESRPSMYPRFPQGTIFVIDPDITPTDGDIVLIRLKKNNDFTLRELIIDPPYWRLSPLVSESKTINFSTEEHETIGVNLLTMLYNSKLDK